ncbi:sugar transferase (plasmid) [Enterococcus faecium]|uniref:sugar transferase n=1 Tax=Enterococcus faecium TaxID=1352 RepID=UPI0038D4A066
MYLEDNFKLSKNGYLDIGKRGIDLVFSTVGLIVLFPLFLIVGFLIKIDSPGPIFFKQMRIGKNGSTFKIYKFRTMCFDAEEKLKSLKDKNEMNGKQFKIKNDPRITNIGTFLRKTSIDELPQLVNVLKGEMSLIGPRPALLEEVKEYSEYEKKRLSVLPGCSGLWQVSGRNNLTFDQMVELDLIYINNINFSNDLKIILKTLKVMLTNEGAY